MTSNDRTKAIAALAYYLPSGAKERIEALRNSLVNENSKVSEEELADKSQNLIQSLAEQALLIYEQKLARERESIEEY